jgi:predicted nucleic acid-binding protein
VLDLTPSVVLEAFAGTLSHQLSLWDALIWASAKLNGIPNVLTEDPQSADLIEGVRYVNPFSASFDLALLD